MCVPGASTLRITSPAPRSHKSTAAGACARSRATVLGASWGRAPVPSSTASRQAPESTTLPSCWPISLWTPPTACHAPSAEPRELCLCGRSASSSSCTSAHCASRSRSQPKSAVSQTPFGAAESGTSVPGRCHSLRHCTPRATASRATARAPSRSPCCSSARLYSTTAAASAGASSTARRREASAEEALPRSSREAPRKRCRRASSCACAARKASGVASSARANSASAASSPSEEDSRSAQSHSFAAASQASSLASEGGGCLLGAAGLQPCRCPSLQSADWCSRPQ
mmetsp:Transcript_12586/g.31882  ORF Transcript_12586/g.31882 Transcript_12586/m.31882 type:complete len:286 (+) Transcript_12586:471-1328(+)